ncbi:MAG: hypothetical protein C5B52_15770, partial [Bacteroidetes bacterium]
MKRNLYLFFLLTIIVLKSFSQPPQTWSVKSPNKNNTLVLSLQNGHLYYTVLFGSEVVIPHSSLGIETSIDNFNVDMRILSSKKESINETYSLAAGKRKVNTARANEMIITVANEKNSTIELMLRAYDDGVAFSYGFTGIKQSFTIVKEYTNFSIPTKGTAWLQSYGLPAEWAPAYEAGYSLGAPIGENAPDTSGWCFPALFNSKNNWILITEAGLDKNFYGSHLAQGSRDG